MLVIHDLLGLFDRFVPKFVKQYRKLHGTIVEALEEYKAEVEAQTFPAAEHSIFMEEAEWQALLAALEPRDRRRSNGRRV